MTDTLDPSDGTADPRRPLAGRTALVTGASRGVGRAIAELLAARGAAVAVNYRDNEAAARLVVDGIRAASGTASAFRASVDDPDATATMLDGIENELGSIDLVVSNAGTAGNGKKIIATEAEEFRALMEIHAFGPVALIRRLLPQLRSHERSDVVVISSAVTVMTPTHSAPYTMAKAAIEAAARTLAFEERKYGLRANIVAPGLVATDLGNDFVGAMSGGEATSLDGSFPYGRVCRPEDVARVVAYLVSPDAGYVNGQRIPVDGGGPDPAFY